MFEVEYRGEIRTVYKVAIGDGVYDSFLTYSELDEKWEWLNINETKPYKQVY